MPRALLVILSLTLILAVDIESETALLSRSLNEIATLNPSNMDCSTPQTQFNLMGRELAAWGDVIQHKQDLPKDIETLTQIKALLEQTKAKSQLKQAVSFMELTELSKIIDKKLSKLKMPKTQSGIGAPQLAQIRNKMKELSSQDPHKRSECCENLLKMCEFLIKQLSSLHQQCQSSPVTIIRIKGKIKDLQVVQQGCCQPPQQCEQPPVSPPRPPKPPRTPTPPSEEVPPSEEEVPPPPSEEEVPPPPPSEEEEVPPPPPSEEEEVPPPPPSEEEEVPPPPSEEEEVPPPPSEEEEVPPPPSEEEEVPPPPSEEEEVPPPPSEEEEVPPPPSEEEEVPPPPSEEEEVPPPPSEEEEVPPPPSEEEEVPPPPSEEEEVPPPPSEEEEVPPPPSEEEEVPPPPSEEEEVPPPPSEEEEVPPPPSEEEEVPPPPSEEEEVPPPPSEEEEVPPPPSEEEEVPPPPSEEEEVPPPPSEEEVPPPPEEEEEVPPPPPPPPERFCNEGSANIVDARHDEVEPIYTQEFDGEIANYGFGFWFRWLQRYPIPFLNGATEEKYFMALLTENNPHGEFGMGDRALALFFGKGGLHFSTYDAESENGDVFVNVPYGQIEGKWTYVYFSYSSVNHRAYAFVEFEGEEPQFVELPGVHNSTPYLKFVLGGSFGTIPSFNGQFAMHQAVAGFNAAVTSIEEYEEYVRGCNPEPQGVCQEQRTIEIINNDKREFNGRLQPFDVSKAFLIHIPEFQDDYSISGWFKWVTPVDQNIWHTAFRLTINDESTNQNNKLLGDRDLGLWIGNERTNNIMAFATYTYDDLHGSGNANYWQALPYQNDLTQWHFVYFTYSRVERTAYAYVEFGTRKGEVHFVNVNHFLSPEYILYVGQDQFYPSYSGKIVNFNVNLCDPAPVHDPVPPPTPIVRTPTPPPPPITPSPPQPPPETPPQTPPVTPPPVTPPPVSPPPPVTPPITPPPITPPPPVIPPTPSCKMTIEITPDNAADILCALSQYLAQLANGHTPDLGVSPQEVCFCLKYNPDDANPQLVSMAQMQQGHALPEPEPLHLKTLLNNQARNKKY